MSIRSAVPLPDDPPTETLERWRARYVKTLASPHGWWSITALDWLEPGANTLGSEPGSKLHVPARFPQRLAVLDLDGEELSVTPEVGGLRLATEPLDGPRTIDLAGRSDLSLFVPDGGGVAEAPSEPLKVNLIRRGPLWGARVHDPLEAARRDPASEVRWFETLPSWVVEADFVRPEAGERVDVHNVIGQVDAVPVAGRARFRWEGDVYELLATEARRGGLFVNFRDATNGSLTYGGGRFLPLPRPVDGRLEIDFNRAHFPPCAHTAYATCPMPTPGNRLPFAVTAGERQASA